MADLYSDIPDYVSSQQRVANPYVEQKEGADIFKPAAAGAFAMTVKGTESMWMDRLEKEYKRLAEQGIVLDTPDKSPYLRDPSQKFNSLEEAKAASSEIFIPDYDKAFQKYNEVLKELKATRPDLSIKTYEELYEEDRQEHIKIAKDLAIADQQADTGWEKFKFLVGGMYGAMKDPLITIENTAPLGRIKSGLGVIRNMWRVGSAWGGLTAARVAYEKPNELLQRQRVGEYAPTGKQIAGEVATEIGISAGLGAGIAGVGVAALKIGRATGLLRPAKEAPVDMRNPITNEIKEELKKFDADGNPLDPKDIQNPLIGDELKSDVKLVKEAVEILEPYDGLPAEVKAHTNQQDYINKLDEARTKLEEPPQTPIEERLKNLLKTDEQIRDLTPEEMDTTIHGVRESLKKEDVMIPVKFDEITKEATEYVKMGDVLKTLERDKKSTELLRKCLIDGGVNVAAGL